MREETGEKQSVSKKFKGLFSSNKQVSSKKVKKEKKEKKKKRKRKGILRKKTHRIQAQVTDRQDAGNVEKYSEIDVPTTRSKKEITPDSKRNLEKKKENISSESEEDTLHNSALDKKYKDRLEEMMQQTDLISSESEMSQEETK